MALPWSAWWRSEAGEVLIERLKSPESFVSTHSVTGDHPLGQARRPVRSDTITHPANDDHPVGRTR